MIATPMSQNNDSLRASKLERGVGYARGGGTMVMRSDSRGRPGVSRALSQIATAKGERPSRSAPRSPMFPGAVPLPRDMTQTRPRMVLRVRCPIVNGSWPTSLPSRTGGEPSPSASNGATVAP